MSSNMLDKPSTEDWIYSCILGVPMQITYLKHLAINLLIFWRIAVKFLLVA